MLRHDYGIKCTFQPAPGIQPLFQIREGIEVHPEVAEALSDNELVLAFNRHVCGDWGLTSDALAKEYNELIASKTGEGHVVSIFFFPRFGLVQFGTQIKDGVAYGCSCASIYKELTLEDL